MDYESYLIAKERLRETIVRGHDYVKTDTHDHSDYVGNDVENAEQPIRDDVMKQLQDCRIANADHGDRHDRI